MSILNFFFEDKKTKRYLAMDHAQLSALSDDDLFEAVRRRTDKAMDKSFGDGVDNGSATDEQVIFFSVNVFDTEIERGGIEQFLFNSSRDFISSLGDALEITGALPYKELFESFLAENKIDPERVSTLSPERIAKAVKESTVFSFEDFDNRYFGLMRSDPLKKYLTGFIRNNIEKF